MSLELRTAKELATIESHSSIRNLWIRLTEVGSHPHL